MTGHTCPGPGCDKEVDQDMLACPRHWYQVSKPTRARVWRAWSHGSGAGTDAHTAAIMQAIKEMRP